MSHSFAVCPAHLTHWPKFLCQSLLLAFGKPWHCQVPAPANNSLGIAGCWYSLELSSLSAGLLTPGDVYYEARTYSTKSHNK